MEKYNINITFIIKVIRGFIDTYVQLILCFSPLWESNGCCANCYYIWNCCFVNRYMFTLIPLNISWKFALELFVKRPPAELTTATAELNATRIELCEVKSIQLQFVKHSKLSRKAIKLEKQVEDIKLAQVPKLIRLRNILWIIRVSVAYIITSCFVLFVFHI